MVGRVISLHSALERQEGDQYEYSKAYEYLPAFFASIYSVMATAECPDTLPSQLLLDRIVHEGAGTGFPASDYHYMDQYLAWKKTQKTPEPASPAGK